MPTRSQKPSTRIPLPRVQVEYLLLADAAEALNGKLYLMGGGWDTISVTNFELPITISLACGVQVPWIETDDEHTLTIRLQDADGQPVAPDLNANFRTGRAPTLPKGAATHAPFAIKAGLKLPGPGSYTFVATIDDEPQLSRRLQFHANVVPQPPGILPPTPAG